ncbi:MAG: hypothetical protein AB8H03_00475 [Saprospiraceae bacterium]
MEILDTPESFEIEVPIRKYWSSMIFHGVLTILIAINLILVLYKGILDDQLYFPIWAFMLLLVFPIFLNLAMWFNYGYEKLIFTNSRLEIIRSNQIFSIKKRINVNEIDLIEIKNKDSHNIFSAFLSRRGKESLTISIWWKMGQLTLKTKESKMTILNGFKENEITKMKTLIEKEIEQRCSKNK